MGRRREVGDVEAQAKGWERPQAERAHVRPAESELPTPAGGAAPEEPPTEGPSHPPAVDAEGEGSAAHEAGPQGPEAMPV